MKHKEKLDMRKIRLVSLISFLLGASQALFIYVMSSYFKLASGTDNVSIFYLVSYAAILILLLNFHKIAKRYGRANIFFGSILLNTLALLGLLFTEPGMAGAGLVVLFIVSSNLEWVGLDVILETYSSDRMSGRIRGMFLTIMNIGILVGPFFSTKILESFSYYGIFLTIFIFNIAILFLSIFSLRDTNHRFNKKLSVLAVLRKIAKRKDICRISYISSILDFFYALTIIYLPIYLLGLGLSWKEIGFILTWMLLPFVFLQYPAGLLADKKVGEKELIIVSILIMGISTIGIYFISSPNIFLWSTVMFLNRTGAAILEILRDSYFYKRIGQNDVDIINIFRAARPAAYILASALSALLLLFFSIETVFILAGVVVLSALLPAIRLQDNKGEKERI